MTSSERRVHPSIFVIFVIFVLLRSLVQSLHNEYQGVSKIRHALHFVFVIQPIHAVQMIISLSVDVAISCVSSRVMLFSMLYMASRRQVSDEKCFRTSEFKI